VHMSDIIEGRVSLAAFTGSRRAAGSRTATCSAGGEGWAKSILYHARARDEFAAFFARAGYLRARRLQRVPDDGGRSRHSSRARTPGRGSSRTRASSFEARLSTMAIVDSPSLFLAGMAGSRIPVVTATVRARGVRAFGR